MSGDFRIGEWTVQPAVNRLRRGDEVVRLEPKVMQVLVCLAENAGEVVTREQLINRVWSDVFVTDDVLHRAIRELRRVFGDSTAAPRYIETIRKRGYRLIPISASAETSDAAGGGGDPLGHSPHKGVPSPGDSPLPRGQSPAGGTVPSRGDRRGVPFSIVAIGIAIAIVAALAALATRTTDLARQAHARFVPVVSGPLNESDPAVSPDGRRIAFVQREPGANTSADIYIRHLDDGTVTRVTDNPASDRMPAWSPDGTRLAFVRMTSLTCDVLVLAIGATTEARIAACPNVDEPKLAWSADGRSLLTSLRAGDGTASEWRLARLDLATAALSPLTTPPRGIVGDHSPIPSPDGREIAFIRRASGGVSDVYVSTVTGLETRRVTFDEADITGIDWSSDGRTIVYSSDRAGGYSLWRVSAQGGEAMLLAGGAARMKHPATDRTGRRVVY